MKAILIDVEKKEITEVEHDGSLDSTHALLKCDCITSAESHLFGPVSHTLFVDDEGLYREPPIGAFQIANGQVLSGNGLIVGAGLEGEDISHNVNIKSISQVIRFCDISELPEPSFEFISF